MDGLNRKESITYTAIEIINEMGIQGLSIRELAKRQGVTEAAIYRHYDSKQAIILSVLNFFAEAGMKVMGAIQEKRMGSKEGILYFIGAHAEFFAQHPDITGVIFAEEIFRDDPGIAQRMKEICEKRASFVTTLVSQGQQRGEITDAFSAEDLGDLIMGLMRRKTSKWRMSGFSFSLRETVMGILQTLFSL